MKITKEQFLDNDGIRYQQKIDEAIENLKHARLWCPINSVMYGGLSEALAKLYEMSLTKD